MTNKSIPTLTAASTPLAGTELVPVWDGAGTKKVSVANLTLGRAVNTAGGTFTDNQIQGTAAKGINFTANTPAAGVSSRLLNWYEEGTWTPTVSGLVLTTALGTYTKIGNKVFANFQIASTALVSASNFDLGGVPFTPKSTTAPDRSAGYLTYNGHTSDWTLLFANGASVVQFRLNPGGGIATITNLSGSLFWGTLLYTATS